ncbi:sugar transferase, partial [Oleiphilus sp. HI0079]|uniref:sugar transferase n=3 Tax=Oleiphilus TaxID=141450 RepID=UPI000AADA55E
RPALVQETDIYSMTARQRLQILPGLTGLWQVSGRADTTFEEQVSLDIRYIKEQSWMKDIKILLSTVPVVLFGRGAY